MLFDNNHFSTTQTSEYLLHTSSDCPNDLPTVKEKLSLMFVISNPVTNRLVSNCPAFPATIPISFPYKFPLSLDPASIVHLFVGLPLYNNLLSLIEKYSLFVKMILSSTSIFIILPASSILLEISISSLLGSGFPLG
jgi:hypothetical protein